jgi:dTDP-4-amino-4,6-dideoxy-D-glucose acyltransferase
MAFLTKEEIKKIGFKYVGLDVQISDKASIYNAKNIEIGDFSRIDDFCVLSAGNEGIKIGNYVHIAVYCSLIGKNKIELQDFSGLSSKVSIYSSSDDYSGEWLTNPIVPTDYTNILHGDVILGKHVIVGVGTCILPNVIIGQGSAIGAFSLVTTDIEEGVIALGTPAKKVKLRKTNLFILEDKLLKENKKINSYDGK